MKRILEFLKNALSREDLMDAEIYCQVLGEPIAESGIPKAKLKATVIREDGNKAIISVTDIGRLTCGHWNIDLAAQCVDCSSTFCKLCVSKGVGFNCLGCGRFVCPSCANVSIMDPEVALCSQCGLLSHLPAIIRRRLCKNSSRP